MKAKPFSLLLSLVIGSATLFASGFKVDGIWYDFYSNTQTASVTYRGSNYDSYSNEYTGAVVIPSSVTYKNTTYSVTSIGESAFVDCSKLTSVTIPNSVTSIGNYAFGECTGLTSVTIPNSVTSIGRFAFALCTGLTSVEIGNSVTSIGEAAFGGCIGLTSVTIPNTVTSIGEIAFYKCTGLTSVVIPNSVKSIGETAFKDCSPNLSVYASSRSVYELLTTIQNRYLVPQDQLNYYYSFSTFAKNYVEQKINEWQKKGEFERVADWQQRVNEQTRQEKIQSLLTEAQKQYIDFHAKSTQLNLALGQYDAENEVFAINSEIFGTLLVSVPFKEAQDFKNNWESKTVTPKMRIYNDEVKLSALTIAMPNGKQYTYRNTDVVNYNLAEVEYNFEPLEINVPQTNTPDMPKGQQNITKTTLKVGASKVASQVDTNIPETKASNPNTFAVIFANEDYKNVASVPFAKNDGAVFRKYCQKTLGIPADNIHYVENATLNDMGYQLAWLKKVCDAFEGKASLIVYYAGHGIPDEASKSAYLLPVDGYGSYVQSAYKLDDMYQKLGAMNAKSVTVFMDACFSGSKREEGMLASARGVAIKVKSGEPQGKMVVFSAASGDETAYPNNDEQHGMFTYYLLKKLQETKGDVTLQDLGDYITTNVRQQSIVKNGKSQTPCVIPSASLDSDWQSWKLK